MSVTVTQSEYQRNGLFNRKDDLLIPHPVKEPEAFAKARGSRAEHPEGHGNEH